MILSSFNAVDIWIFMHVLQKSIFFQDHINYKFIVQFFEEEKRYCINLTVQGEMAKVHSSQSWN